MVINNKSNLSWQYDNYKNIIENKQLSKITLNKIENVLLVNLPRNIDFAVNIIPELDKHIVILKKELRKITVAKKSLRDDIICLIILLNSILGYEKKASLLIDDIEKNKINGINQRFVLDKAYNYYQKGNKLCKVHKLWSKLIRSYKKGEISALNKNRNTKVKQSLKREKNKSFFQKILEFLGL